MFLCVKLFSKFLLFVQNIIGDKYYSEKTKLFVNFIIGVILVYNTISIGEIIEILYLEVSIFYVE